MILATTAEVYERFADHPGWGWGRTGRDRYEAWLDIAVRDPETATSSGGGRIARTLEGVAWLERRSLHRTACIVDAALLLGDGTPDEAWCYLEAGEVVCSSRCRTCRTVAGD